MIKSGFSRLVSFLVILLGLSLLVGGVYLAGLGGSVYYLAAGILLTASGVLIWRRRALGMLLYFLFVLLTILWALWESGLNPWALLPRVLLPLCLGALVLLVSRWWDSTREWSIGAALFGVETVIVIALFAVGNRSPDGLPAPRPVASFPIAANADQDWPSYGGPGGTHSSNLSSINAQNVHQLSEAWIYRQGAVNPLFSHELTPLKIGGRIYGCTPDNKVFALDPTTGKQLWKFDSKSDIHNVAHLICRNVAFVGGAEPEGQPCAERVVFATLDARLMGVDAATGRPCPAFGKNGAVSLLSGLGKVTKGDYYLTSGPVLARGLIVVGASVKDNASIDMPSGVVRAFDPATGELRWAWDMGRPDAPPMPARGETYTRSTPNAWGPLSADDALGLVYIPLGNPSPDFFGGQRRPFDEKYGSSIVALDALTGRVRWSFQTTHHDIWDYDVAAQPVLFDMPDKNGRTTPAVAVATKRGEIFILDRATGKPLVPVVERPVSTNGVPGERVAPTQPFTVGFPNFRDDEFKESDMWGVTPIDQMICRIKFRESRWEGHATPPGLEPTLQMPGLTGGINWGGLAVDPGRQVMIVNSTRMPFRLQLVKRRTMAAGKNGGPEARYSYYWSQMAGTPYLAHVEPFVGPLEVPCIRPPWGMITAIDLRTRKVLWRHALGTSRENGPLGIRTILPLPIGVPSVGGALVTQGGLVVIAAATDRYLRALDINSGRELWRRSLPGGGHATPMTYTAGGRQFIVLDAGGHMPLATRPNNTLIAFALPDRR
jgi:quinoprotein glucose dehydrogenase